MTKSSRLTENRRVATSAEGGGQGQFRREREHSQYFVLRNCKQKVMFKMYKHVFNLKKKYRT